MQSLLLGNVVTQMKEKLLNGELWSSLGEKLIEILIVIVIAYAVTTIAKVIIRKFFKLNRNATERFSNPRTLTLMKLVESVFVYSINFIVILSSLESLGIPVTSILAGAGVLGLAVGFGAQNLVKDVITGFFVLLEDQFSVGDYIRIGLFEGTIEEIGLRTTRLKSVTGEIHILPNGSITAVTNFSRNNSIAIVDVAVSYESDIPYTEGIIQELLEELPAKYEDMVKAPELLGVQLLGGSEVVLRITAEVRPMQHHIIARALRKEIKMRLDEKGIEIPYPRMVLFNTKEEEQNKKSGKEQGA